MVHSWINVWVAGKTVWFLLHVPFLSALEVVYDDALYKSTFTLLCCILLLFYCCVNNANRSRISISLTAWGALSATPTYYSATCIVFLLYTNSCTRHNYCTASMQCRAYHQQTWRITNLVDVNWTVTVINQRRLPPVLLMTPRERTVVDADYRAADGHKFSAVRRLSFKQHKWPWRSLKVTGNGVIR